MSPFCSPGGHHIPPATPGNLTPAFPHPMKPWSVMSPGRHVFTVLGQMSSLASSKALVRGRWIGKGTFGKQILELGVISQGWSWWH